MKLKHPRLESRRYSQDEPSLLQIVGGRQEAAVFNMEREDKGNKYKLNLFEEGIDYCL